MQKVQVDAFFRPEITVYAAFHQILVIDKLYSLPLVHIHQQILGNGAEERYE